MYTWVYAIGGLVALALLIKLLVRTIGCNCHQCGRRMMFWDELPEDDKQDIMAYFQQYETRAPDTSSIFVCPDCRYVYDDFSGEKRSMAGDNASFCKVCGPPCVVNYFGFFGAALNRGVVHGKNALLLDKTECLSCTKNPLGAVDCISCTAATKAMACNHCGTLHAWLPMMEKGFLYTVPLTEENIKSRGPTEIPL